MLVLGRQGLLLGHHLPRSHARLSKLRTRGASRPQPPHVRRLLTAAPAMATASGGRPLRFRLPDAHAHPQDDMPSAVRLLPAAGDSGVQASAVAVMGVREADWEHVLQLSQLAPAKVIPCFGVHPWFAHQHLAPGTAGDGGPQAEQGSSSNNNSSFAALCEQRGARGGMFTLPRQAAGAPPEELQGLVAALLPAPPSSTWAARLEELLRAHPQAVVGECGLDRAAVVPGTKVSVSLEHQVALVRHHLALAGRLQRPISMHCVRATGAMQELLQSLPADQLPPRIMLHSFGGPPEAIRQLLLLSQTTNGKGTTSGGGGVSSRLYFSFSTAINLPGDASSSSSGGDSSSRTKLVERIRAVPEDRLLIESDQNSVLRMDQGLDAILRLVAEARGWDLRRAAEVSLRNFEAFYEGFLPAGWAAGGAGTLAE